MRETFKWIKFLVVESQKDGLQVDCERRVSFSKYVKNANI